MSDVVNELRETSLCLSSYSVDRGSQDAGLASLLADRAADEIEALLAERDALRKASEWQPIETAPKDGTDILVTDDRIEDGFPQVVYWDDGRWHVNDAGISYFLAFFTHWMPIPNPPVHP